MEMSKENLKQQIIKMLERQTYSVSASTILFELKNCVNNQNLTSRKIGAVCGELVREGKLIKEYKVPNQFYGFYSLTSIWLKQTEKWIRNKIPFQLPDAKVELEIVSDDNVLDGRTRIEKQTNLLAITIRIRISKNLLKNPNIYQAVKMILIHEFSHVVSPSNPDLIMKRYFPKEFEVWEKGPNCHRNG